MTGVLIDIIVVDSYQRLLYQLEEKYQKNGKKTLRFKILHVLDL